MQKSLVISYIHMGDLHVWCITGHVYWLNKWNEKGCTHSALLWQKEASHKSPKSEKVMFQIGLSIFYFHYEFGAETLILLKDIEVKTSLYCIWCQCTWQTHFAHLWEMSFSRVASFCQSMAALIVGNKKNCPYKLSKSSFTSHEHRAHTLLTRFNVLVMVQAFAEQCNSLCRRIEIALLKFSEKKI